MVKQSGSSAHLFWSHRYPRCRGWIWSFFISLCSSFDFLILTHKSNQKMWERLSLDKASGFSGEERVCTCQTGEDLMRRGSGRSYRLRYRSRNKRWCWEITGILTEPHKMYSDLCWWPECIAPAAAGLLFWISSWAERSLVTEGHISNILNKASSSSALLAGGVILI